MYIPRLRRISDVINEIKEQDKDTMLTHALIEQWVKQGNITPMKYGNAWLINLDELYLSFTTRGEQNGIEEQAPNED